MKYHIKRKIQTGVILICSFILICPSAPVRADEITDLENRTSTLSGQLDGINQEMVKISDEITSVNSQIEIIRSEILRTRDSLSIAQADESQRYEDMKSRIKYMYEVGNVSLLEMLFSADSMSDFLNKAEFIENISSYDRDMLFQLQSVREGIAEQEQTLLNQQASLEDLQVQLQTRQTELKTTAEATSTDLATFTAQLTMLREEEARKALADKVIGMMQEAIDNNEEFTLQNLVDLQIDGLEVSSTVNENTAIIVVDIYTFNIDSNFNLTDA